MTVLLIKRERTVHVNGQDRVVSKGNQWYVDEQKDFHHEGGVVPKAILQEVGQHTVGKDTMCVVPTSWVDDRLQLKQDVQKMVNKDLGFILAYTGLNKESVVAESGTGSGGASNFFAPHVKKIFSYDIREDSINKVKKDFAKFNFTHAEFAVGDVCKKDDVHARDVDVFLLDVPEPWRAWDTMLQSVKVGGFVVGYTINANQLQQFVNTCPDQFMKVHACEIMERHWRVKGLVVRPESADFSHTAFLTFFRRIC